MGGMSWQSAFDRNVQWTESPLYPGLHQKRCDQQVKQEDSAPLSVVRPHLEYCIQHSFEINGSTEKLGAGAADLLHAFHGKGKKRSEILKSGMNSGVIES